MNEHIPHIVSVDDFDPVWTKTFFEKVRTSKLKQQKQAVFGSTALQKKTIAMLLFETSFRTRLSFQSAIERLGGNSIVLADAKLTAEAKCERFEDMIRLCEFYAEAIVIRHSEVGAAKKAAEISSIPVINAGDGISEHPTQALADLYTIWEQFHDREVNLCIVGDLKNGRTVHSLTRLVTRMNGSDLGMVKQITLVSPSHLRLQTSWRGYINAGGLEFKEVEHLDPDLIYNSDVIYMTRNQTERGSGASHNIILTERLVEHLRDDAIIMHPFPRNEEIPSVIDHLPQARYFQQAENGFYVRMQLLEELLA